MEKALKALFDFQRFENNPDLAKIIEEVHARRGAASSRRQMLSLDDAEWVNAAGSADYLPPDRTPGKDGQQ